MEVHFCRTTENHFYKGAETTTAQTKWGYMAKVGKTWQYFTFY